MDRYAAEVKKLEDVRAARGSMTEVFKETQSVQEQFRKLAHNLRMSNEALIRRTKFENRGKKIRVFFQIKWCS